MDIKVALAIISTVLVWLPLAVGIAAFSKAGKYIRFFCLYLFLGFLTDALAWSLYASGIKGGWFSSFVFKFYDLYSPLEALFFFWFIGYSSKYIFDGQYSVRFLLIFTVPIWLLLYFGLNHFVSGFTFDIFDALYAIIVVFLSSTLLLKMTELDFDLLREPFFWLLTGIFFYNFSSFFIMILKQTAIGLELWFLHNLINIATYVVYTIGFLTARRKSNGVSNQ